MSLVEFGRYPDAALAQIIRARLEAAGIPAFCFDTGMNVIEGIPMLFKVRVMVASEDVAEARAVIAEDLPEEAAGPWDDAGQDETETGVVAGLARKRRWIAGCLLLLFFSPVLIFAVLLAFDRN